MVYHHTFHIPVMATGHSVDTPIRVAWLGISSAISLVDDWLLDQIGHYYAAKEGLPYPDIAANARDGRAERITAYLNLVKRIVDSRLAATQTQPFFGADGAPLTNDKARYFRLLPDTSLLKRDHARLLSLPAGAARDALAAELTERMSPGSIDVNIMVKLDRTHYETDGTPLPDEYSDARAALRGYANSDLASAIIFSAGINQALFTYMSGFRAFYRDASGQARKKIVLKVSSYRSARIQGKFLARLGLEVYEYRVESGLNCGGHAFASDGELFPVLLDEFRSQRDDLATAYKPTVTAYYAEKGWEYPPAAMDERPLITAQGGVGTSGEHQRLLEDFGMDRVGWASPFLLVPEATPVDDATRELLRAAGAEDLYLSDVSPINVPFNNLRGTGSERITAARVAEGRPGSPCGKGIARLFATEFGEPPLCIASRQYQRQKLAQIDALEIPEGEKQRQRDAVTVKTCICTHLGNSALIALGLASPEEAPQCVCPGPNIAWFDRLYTLDEMADHIYGRGEPLTPPERPHMFAAEIGMYVDEFAKQVAASDGSPRAVKGLNQYAEALRQGMAFCLEIAERAPFTQENLASIAPAVETQAARLDALCARLVAQAGQGQGDALPRMGETPMPHHDVISQK